MCFYRLPIRTKIVDNHLSPRLKRGNWTNKEDENIVRLQAEYGITIGKNVAYHHHHQINSRLI